MIFKYLHLYVHSTQGIFSHSVAIRIRTPIMLLKQNFKCNNFVDVCIHTDMYLNLRECDDKYFKVINLHVNNKLTCN